MSKPTVLITNAHGIAEAQVYRPGVVVEIRNYDLENRAAKPETLWKDESGRSCIRSFVRSTDYAEAGKDLERFVEDLRTHTRIKAEFDRSADPEGLHVIRIGKADFYFAMDGTYDGWGREVF